MLDAGLYPLAGVDPARGDKMKGIVLRKRDSVCSLERASGTHWGVPSVATRETWCSGRDVVRNQRWLVGLLLYVRARATESSGARVMHDGEVSSGSPVDIAYVPRNAAQIHSHSGTSCIVSLSEQTGPYAVWHSFTRSSSFSSLQSLPPTLAVLRNVRLNHLLVASVDTLLGYSRGTLPATGRAITS